MILGLFLLDRTLDIELLVEADVRNWLKTRYHSKLSIAYNTVCVLREFFKYCKDRGNVTVPS